MNEFLSRLKDSVDVDLSDVKLSELNVYIKRDLAEVVLVCPEEREKSLSENADKIEAAARDILKTAFTVKLKIKKSYFDEANFTYRLIDFLAKYPIIRHCVKSGNFTFEYPPDKIKAIISLPTAVAEYAEGRILGEINAFVYSNYCEKIEVSLLKVETQDEEEPEDEENELVYDYEGGRKIKIANVEPFIGDAIYEKPSYIIDVRMGDGMVMCGTVKDFREYKRTKREGEEQKYFYKFTLSDFTGSIDCIYFPTKKTIDKIKLIHDGNQIVAFGSVMTNTYNGATTLTYRIRYISLCTLPENFVINRARLQVPKKYKFVSPKPYEEYLQDEIFKQKEEIPQFLLGKEFVVYDLETTGLNQLTDKIIEIGAVKIKDGIISESFSTFVDPECLIPEKTTSITGITDASVKGAPTISEAMPDFYKFAYGAVMVGQNSLQFDWPFIRAKAEPMNIYFENEQMDILALAKKYYPEFGKYNLDYMSKMFGIVNESAHRALSDAVTTAKIFIKIAAKLQ